MRLAIMQPYIFPYVGYFQLLKSVDTFVFFDDVQFKRRSYITRNSILINDKANTFSIPVKKERRSAFINEMQLHDDQFEIWKDKFLKSLAHAYAKAPFFERVFKLVEAVFNARSSDLVNLTQYSVEKTCQYLNIEVSFKNSSSIPYTHLGDGQDKILSICGILQANTYINAINGQDLYTEDAFKNNGLELLFLNPAIEKYRQFNESFTSHLSIIDMMMFLSPEDISAHLERYTLITK